MKNYKKTVLASLATIGASCALIGGATFALFTSDSTTNIAVTSGKVDVQAVVLEKSIVLTSMDKVMDETFEVGGTAEYVKDTNSFEIDGMVAGDYIEFDIEITNYSTVAVKYQSKVSYEGDKALFKALDFTIEDLEFVDAGDAAYTDWADLAVGSEKIVKHVKMGIPETYEDKIVNGDDTNSIQGKDCSITFTVTAVQGNATTTNPERAIRTAVVAGVGKANGGLDEIGAYGSRFSDLEYVEENDAWESTLIIDYDLALEDIENSDQFADEFDYLYQIIFKVIDVINYAVEDEVASIYSIQVDEQEPQIFNGESIDDEWWLQNDLMAVAFGDGPIDINAFLIRLTQGMRVPVYITGMDGTKVEYALTILVSGVPEDLLG